MTEWKPPIETGLYGNVYVDDAFASHFAETDTDGDHELRAPAVYALRLSTPDTRDVVRERWGRVYDVDIPEFIWSAFEADSAFYVGSTHDLYGRIYQHSEGTKTASICRVYPPHSIHRIWWYDDADTAADHEGEKAMELQNSDPEIAVHWN